MGEGWSHLSLPLCIVCFILFLATIFKRFNYGRTIQTSVIKEQLLSLLPQKRPPCPLNLPLGNIFYRTKEVFNENTNGLTNYESSPGDELLAIRNLGFVEQKLENLEIYRNYQVSRCGGRDELYFLWEQPKILREASGDVHDDTPPSSVYLMAQSISDESVGHMIHEMVLGLRHWAPLLKRFPLLQLGVRNMKHIPSWQVKELFFYALGVPLSRIVELDFCSTSVNFPHDDSNLVFFPTPVYVAGKNVREAKRGWEWFENALLPLAGLPPRRSCSSRPAGMVIVPRKPSHHLDVRSNNIEILAPLLQEWAVREFGAVILNVNNVSDLAYDEVAVLGRARVIVNVVGSGFEFAAMIARGATIIAPNKPTTPWYYNWVVQRALLAYNSQYNRIVLTSSDDGDIRAAIRAAAIEASLPCPLLVPDDVQFDPPVEKFSSHFSAI